MHSIQQTLVFFRELFRYRRKRFEMPDVLRILLATFFVGPPGLGAHQGLGRADALSLMRHVQLVMLNDPMQMLAAIFADAKPVDLAYGIFRKGLQLAAVGAAAVQSYRLGPIGGLLGRKLAARQEKFRRMLP